MNNTNAKLEAYYSHPLEKRFEIAAYHGRSIQVFYGLHNVLILYVLDDEIIAAGFTRDHCRLVCCDMVTYNSSLMDAICTQIDLPELFN